MFNGFGSPWKDVQRRLSRSISRAGEILTGVGPTPAKQFKNAILDGEEDKAIDIYTSSESDKALWNELPPSKPFPSKKHQTSAETPLHLSAKVGLLKLFVALLGKGGDPTILNEKLETCLHSVCSSSTNAEIRAAIMEVVLQWRGSVEQGHTEEKVSLNRVDIDGNTAIHLAAQNGLFSCVEKLIALGAIISIVNKSNRTCCELADESQHLDLALALELALVYQPIDRGMEEFASHQTFPYDGVPGRVLLSGETLDGEKGLEQFIDEAICRVSEALCADHNASNANSRNEKSAALKANGKEASEDGGFCDSPESDAHKFRPRAEVLLTSYSWNVVKLLQEYRADPTAVLTSARLRPVVTLATEVAQQAASPAVPTTESPPPPPVLVPADLPPPPPPPPASSPADLTPPPPPSVNTSADLPPPPPPAAVEEAGNSTAALGATTEKMMSPEDEAVSDPAPEAALAATEEPAASAAATPACTTPAVSAPIAASSSSASAVAPMDAGEDSCFVCGEAMLPSADVADFLAGTIDQPGSRRLQCDSGHAFCVDCWSGSVTVQVKDNGLGCLPCPGYKCGELLDVRWAPVLLKSADTVSAMLSRRSRLVVDCCSQLKACPIDNCGVVVCIPVQPEPSRARESTGTSAPASPVPKALTPLATLCANGHVFCIECMQPAHSPCACAQLAVWHQLVQDEIKTADVQAKGGDPNNVEGAELANALWVAANTKKCPRCQTPIEKDEGCNHMNCRKCRKEFCWICMQDWSLHSDNTGGYFQCNRFVANLKMKDIPEGSMVSDLWTEESGNAHAETLRLRERNKRMARFIHHFTRYQAHGESVKLEGRMFKETARRIKEGLLASLDGGSLKWLQGYQAPNPLLHNVDVSTIKTPPAPQKSGEKSTSAVGKSGEKGAPTLRSVPSTLTLSTTAEEQASGYNYEYATGFLKEGFEELLKCRCILQWSYPYAYFEFENEDYGDYSRMTASQRRSRFDRSAGHRPSFDLLQAELESIVETLSDVVARRRLRAGRDQIVLVTRAAKSKRIELESIILAHSLAQQTAKVKRSSAESSPANRAPSIARQSASGSRRQEGYHRTRPLSSQGSRYQTIRGLDEFSSRQLLRSDSDDSVDLAALIYELELATTTAASAGDNTNAGGEAVATSGPEGGSSAQDAHSRALETILQRGRRLELMQLRMQALFGPDQPQQEAGSADSAALPPPIPQTTSSDATPSRSRPSDRANGVSTANPNAPQTSPARRAEVRQVRGSPGGANISYSIDPDFEMDESDDDTSEEGDAQRNAGNPSGIAASREAEHIDLANLRAADETTAALRNLLRFGSPDEINRFSETIQSTPGASGTPAPTRGSSSNPSSSQRQQLRLSRMAQRAEEEAALNRAILMSIQENQTPSRAAPGGDNVTGEPPEADVAMLVSMGFTREQSVQALVENRLNVELAANRLLGIDF